MKNLDTAFRQVRMFCLVFLSLCFLMTCYAIYKSYDAVKTANSSVYVIANGQVIRAKNSEREENLEVEIRDHVETFHHLFFTLDPDEKVIKQHILQALYLTDGSAKQLYDDLQEKGFYTNIISGNISQRINIDSVVVNSKIPPYSFRCYATEDVIRSTNNIKRALVTSGTIREVSRSDNNPHGFLIENWKILFNQDIKPLNIQP
ncbi:conjugative transposon protein TraK [Pedobacter psychrophilus]|nr:conjugative transposon protein TraK [Pedobacter psychrophilus]